MEIARRDGGAGLRGLSPIPRTRRAGGGVLAGRYAGAIYVVSSAGTLHALGQSSGIDVQRPAPFLPPNARYSDLTAIGGMLYTSTSNELRRRRQWRVGDHARRAETRTSARGRPMAEARSAISHSHERQDSRGNRPGTPAPEDMQTRLSRSMPRHCSRPTGSTSAAGEFVTTPVVFSHSGGRSSPPRRATGASSSSTPLHSAVPITRRRSSARHRSGQVAPDALAAFEQPAGTPWLLVPTARAIVAFRIVQDGGKVSLQKGWTSRELAAPTAPIVVNDVVFAAASGRPQGAAVLYAFDSRSGRELWKSGKTMTSYVPPANIWASNSQVHVGTHDGTVYAFGYVLERR